VLFLLFFRERSGAVATDSTEAPVAYGEASAVAPG
jgi:hypothetical protein